MRYLVWILRLLVFIVVLMFALKNTGPVDVNFFADHVVTGVPLIVVMLSVFVLGVVFGLLVAAPSVVRRRREANKLRRDLARLEEKLRHPNVPGEALAPETVAPLAPL
ncbi:LapA family protein [Candidimonas sp. SYP-B2681]|uniref:LapA family protein n=1 Tax=Candidimonas sp. SYP-B2681 TaxID=2497686 RepID=UPI000F868409|nr:LapA family protein [Candidimonas sp. SYP-B2681]RTZ40992.1 LapA family protein [Candidimonas sp. SYP-B2681]